MKKPLPTLDDFVVYGDFDEESAARNLLGLSTAEVSDLIQGDFLRYQEYFMFMGPVAFCFYVESMISYVLDDCDQDDFMIFHDLCEYRLDDKLAKKMTPCAISVAECLEAYAAKLPDVSGKAVRHTAQRYRTLVELA